MANYFTVANLQTTFDDFLHDFLTSKKKGDNDSNNNQESNHLFSVGRFIVLYDASPTLFSVEQR